MLNELKIKLFVSYSHLDEKWKNQLHDHLSFLKQYGDMVEIWQDRKISGGGEWKPIINGELSEANIILLLISSNFLKSRYCYDIEFQEALKRHKNQEAVVIPIIIHDVYWQWRQNGHNIGLDDLKALPTDGKAVSTKWWSNKHEAYTDIAKGIDVVVKELMTPPPDNTTNLTQAQKIATKIFAKLARDKSSSSLPGHIESDTFNDVLYTALSNLNYIEQKDTFRQFLDSRQRIGAFLLYGGYERGQDWILNLLLKLSPDLVSRLSTAIRIPFVFTRKGCGRSIEDLWDDLAIKTGQHEAEPDKIVDAIYTLWQTQTVLLILRGVEAVEESYIQNFLNLFWYPLVKKALEGPAPTNYCMLFFIDNQGRKWQFAQHFDTMFEPCIPIDLGKLTKFSTTELNRWRTGEVGRLSSSVSIDKILEGSDNGLPELVLKNICKLSGDNWRRKLAVWTPY